MLASTRVLLVGSDDVDTMTSAARRARAEGVRTVGDLERVHDGTPGLLQHLDVLITAEQFPSALTGKRNLDAALDELVRLSGAAMVCVTLGERGCLARVGNHEITVPAFRVDVRDTTGAGDLFRAGFIARWLAEPEEPDVADLLRYANATAALNCRAVGAFTGAPLAAEVDALVRA
jgi:sugar/nucleoside kinase (ribokinase family)